MKRSYVGGAVGAVLVILFAALFQSQRPRTPQPPAGHLIAAFDRTGSTEREEIRTSQLRELYALIDIAFHRKIPATFWAMDNGASVIFDDGVPPYSDEDDVIKMVKEELGLLEYNPDRDAAQWRIAQPGVLLEKALEVQRKKDALGPICLYISTDGAAENPGDISRFLTQARAWAEHYPHMNVIVSGPLSKKDEKRWDQAFAHLGNRYATFTLGDRDEALKRVRSVMYGDLRHEAEEGGDQ